MKYSKKFNTDWDFYLQNNWLDFLTNNITAPPISNDGLDAKECFFIYDSTGKLNPCKEPDLFCTVLNRKANINLQIKMWVEGFKDVMQPVEEYMKSFNGNTPNWVKKAFIRSLKSKYFMTSPENWFKYD